MNKLFVHRMRWKEKWRAVLQTAHSRSWHRARPATPSSEGTAMSCDTPQKALQRSCDSMPRPGVREGGLGLGQASGTEQLTPDTLTGEIELDTRKRTERIKTKQTTTRTQSKGVCSPRRNNLYFHNSFTYSFYFEWKEEGGIKKTMYVGAGNIMSSFIFLEVVNMFVLRWNHNVGLN